MRESLAEPPRGPLISRFAHGRTLTSVSPPTLESPGNVSLPTATRPLLDRFMSDEEPSNYGRSHRGVRFRGRGGRGRNPPLFPSVFRHQPLQTRLTGGASVKNNSLLERME
jgi:hypothetical protein